MIRQQAFINEGNRMLRGGLHCHTTRSDGSCTPEEAIRLHAENGYDFLALTDHRIYNFTDFAPDAGLMILPGMEMDRSLPEPGHVFHTVCLGPREGNGYAQDQRFASGSVKDQFEYQKVLDEIHGNGNLTVYCHPDWSSTPTRDFEALKGNFALEIWNTGCVLNNEMDRDASCWDELLRQGKRIWGVATDDGHAKNEHCKGWVMVNAPKDVDAVLAALRDGKFYSSCGPEIRDFYIEDGKAVVACSPVERVRFHFSYFPHHIVRAEETPLEGASCALKSWFTYVRASVVDAEGRMAWTNPIFLPEP